jgi:hypothetical protein
MSPNRRRGEIVAELDGKPRKLCLTLGALAELETAYAAADLAALVERFSTGRLSAMDMMRIIGAGLRGSGETASDEEVGTMQTGDGAAGFAANVADLLSTTYGATPEAASAKNP